MIPNENLSIIISFGERYNASYLVLTTRAIQNRRSLTPVWEGEMTDIFELCAKTDTYRIYFIKISNWAFISISCLELPYSIGKFLELSS